MIEAMKQALEAFENIDCLGNQKALKAITSLRRAIAEAEQDKPVAVVTGVYGGRFIVEPTNRAMVLPDNMALYAQPQQRKPVKFPTMIRRMWSGGDVQAWLDENVNKE